MYHNRRLERLEEESSVYGYCFSGRCLAPEADRPRGCPQCPVTQAFNELRAAYARILRSDTLREITEEGKGGAEAESELERRLAAGLGFGDVLDSISIALELERMVGEDEISPKWSLRTAEVIKVIRQERSAVRREETGRTRREREDERRAQDARYGLGYRGETED